MHKSLGHVEVFAMIAYLVADEPVEDRGVQTWPHTDSWAALRLRPEANTSSHLCTDISKRIRFTVRELG